MSALELEGTWHNVGGVMRWVPPKVRAPRVEPVEVAPTPRVRGCADCGTDSGYYRHIRTLKEPACGPCLRAHSAYESARYRRQKAAS